MNKLIVSGFILAAGIILTDHMIFTIPHYAAVILYTAAIIMIIAGMIASKKDPE